MEEVEPVPVRLADSRNGSGLGAGLHPTGTPSNRNSTVKYSSLLPYRKVLITIFITEEFVYENTIINYKNKIDFFNKKEKIHGKWQKGLTY